MNGSTLLQAALGYAELGYRVFPCRPGQKIPATEHGCKDATNDTEQIEQWWTENPEYNVAIATDGLCVVDVDGKENPWLQQIDQACLLTAASQRTPRGGVHYAFRSNGLPVGNTASKIAPHVDTRGNGGYILVSPSVVDGKPYVIVRQFESPEQLPRAPDWILAAIVAHPETVAPFGIDIQKGKRNETLYRLSCSLRGAGLSIDAIHAALIIENSRRCKPPLGDRELQQIARSAGQQPVDEDPEIDLSGILRQLQRLADRPAFARLLSSQELVDLDIQQDFLIDGVLVKAQPGVIGGRSKSMKTSIATDLVMSLASGEPFLNRFATVPTRVAFWSGESGVATIRETARRIARSKGIQLGDCLAWWCFELPKLTRADHLCCLAEIVEERSIEVVIVDPLYLSLLSPQTATRAGNLFAMGSMLEGLSKLVQASGATFIAIHHFRKSGVVDDVDPCGLEELTQSGVAEWARQWLLLQRRSPYSSDGRHELWMRAGGSFGHAGFYAVDVQEGLYEAENPEGRYWDVAVRSVSDARTEAHKAREEKQQASKTEREARQIAECRDAIELALIGQTEGESLSQIMVRSGKKGKMFDAAFGQLLREGKLVECWVRRENRQAYRGYKWSF